jgi:hypothetical protein
VHYLFITGPLNPIPFALITNCCLGWTIYAVLNGDYFIFMSNCFPLVFGMVLCLTAVHILEQSDGKMSSRDQIIRLRVEGILVFCASLWIAVSFITGFILRADKYFELRVFFVGLLCDISTLLFYAAPLVNISEVIKMQDASSLYAPAITVNLFSSVLWFFYGLMGVKEVVVWVPSAAGILLCVIELFICCYYPSAYYDIKDESVVTAAEFPIMGDFAVFASSRRSSVAFIAPFSRPSSPPMTPRGGQADEGIKKKTRTFKPSSSLFSTPMNRSRAASVTGNESETNDETDEETERKSKFFRPFSSLFNTPMNRSRAASITGKENETNYETNEENDRKIRYFKPFTSLFNTPMNRSRAVSVSDDGVEGDKSSYHDIEKAETDNFPIIPFLPTHTSEIQNQ